VPLGIAQGGGTWHHASASMDDAKIQIVQNKADDEIKSGSGNIIGITISNITRIKSKSPNKSKITSILNH